MSELKSKVQTLAVVDTNTWITRAEAAKILRCSITTIKNKFEKTGRLQSVCDPEGVWRFSPNAVLALAEEMGIESDDVESRANAYARADLANSIRLMRTVLEPREKLDRVLFETLDRQAARIKELEEALVVAYRKQQAAEDQTSERTVIADMFREKEKRITELLSRAMGHAEKFFAGGGTPFLHSLTPTQMAMLWSVKSDFTPDQQQAIEDAAGKLGFKPPEEEGAEAKS